MTNWIFAAILFVNVVGLLLLWVAMARFAILQAKLQQAEDNFRAFITPPAEGQASPLALSVQAAADMLGRSVAAQVKATLMGAASGAARAQQAIEGDIAEDMAKQTAIGSALMAMPTLRKTLRRNPGLLDLALNALGKLGSPGSTPVNGDGSQPKFHL